MIRNRRYRDTVLGLCTLAFFVTMVGRLAISPVVPTVTAEFGVSNAVIGTALSGMWLAYALTQFPSGILADRYGERLVILVSVGGTGLVSLGLAFSPHFAVFLVGTVLLGGAAGLHYSVATTFLTRIYDDVGTAVGIHNGGAPVAGLLTPVAVAWVAARYGWRPAIAVGAFIAVPTFVLFARYVRPTEPRKPDRSMREQIDPGALLDIVTRPSIVFSSAIAILADFTWQALASFLPTFLIEHHGHSTALASTFFAAYFVVQGVLQIGVGALSDRYGRDLATGVCLLAGIGGITVLVGGSGLLAVSTGILLLGLSMGWGAAVIPRVMDHLTAEERGTAFGFVRTAYMIVASTGSIVVGLFADRFGWGTSFLLLGGLMALGVALLVGNRVLGADL